MKTKSDTILLIKETYAKDDIGQEIAEQTARRVYCQVGSVSHAEWYDGGRNGLRGDLVFYVFFADYDGEELVEYKDAIYMVYRTYRRADDRIELYVQRRSGIDGEDN